MFDSLEFEMYMMSQAADISSNLPKVLKSRGGEEKKMSTLP
jgi:hypothetical protein